MRTHEVYGVTCHGCGRAIEVATSGPMQCSCGAPLQIDWLASRRDYDALSEAERTQERAA
jgi:hypothetical protein